jgi:hypothetical protein
MSAQDDAKKLVDDFAALPTCPSVWPFLDRAEIAAGLKIRIDDPDKIKQTNTSLCGPADFARDVAEDKPVQYAQAVIDLYKTGSAHIETFIIKPGGDLKNYTPTADKYGNKINAADWILLASIRDTDNWWFDYESVDDDAAAMTLPHSKEKWLRSAGYGDIINETNLVFCKDLSNAAKASRLFQSGYKVALFINGNMMKAKDQNSASVTPDHWVALTSAISIKSINLTRPGTLVEDKSSKISFEVYSWGRRNPVPEKGTFTDYTFLQNYYGFIACRR